MNTMNISNEDIVKYMINILPSHKVKQKSVIKICNALLNCINGAVHKENKNRIAIYGSLIHEILNQKNNKPFKKVNNINLLVSTKDKNNIANAFGFGAYQKISNLYADDSVIETGKLNLMEDVFGFNIIITTINIEISDFINNHLKFEFNKAYYLLNNIHTSINYNQIVQLNKKNIKFDIGFLLQQMLHGMRYQINCSI